MTRSAWVFPWLDETELTALQTGTIECRSFASLTEAPRMNDLVQNLPERLDKSEWSKSGLSKTISGG
jgi:hypothetical protein